MALTEIGGGGINYIQSSAPSSPEDKEIWIDVSSSPPLVKVYDADNTTWESATNVLSDGSRFAGANVDASISTRATQSDILSDATPFDGANIDAAISSVGGVDWKKQSYGLQSNTTASYTISSGATETVSLYPVDISGSAILNPANYIIQIDMREPSECTLTSGSIEVIQDGDKYEYVTGLSGTNAIEISGGMFPFDTSLKIGGTATIDSDAPGDRTFEVQLEFPNTTSTNIGVLS